MNGWFLVAGALLVVAFFVHSVFGNRLYAAARPEHTALRAYDAWLMGRCGMQMIGADLLLAAVFLLLAGSGVVSPFAGVGVVCLVDLLRLDAGLAAVAHCGAFRQ